MNDQGRGVDTTMVLPLVLTLIIACLMMASIYDVSPLKLFAIFSQAQQLEIISTMYFRRQLNYSTLYIFNSLVLLSDPSWMLCQSIFIAGSSVLQRSKRLAGNFHGKLRTCMRKMDMIHQWIFAGGYWQRWDMDMRLYLPRQSGYSKFLITHLK